MKNFTEIIVSWDFWKRLIIKTVEQYMLSKHIYQNAFGQQDSTVCCQSFGFQPNQFCYVYTKWTQGTKDKVQKAEVIFIKM